MKGCEPRLIELAGHINSQDAGLCYPGISDALNGKRKCLNGANILCVGESPINATPMMFESRPRCRF